MDSGTFIVYLVEQGVNEAYLEKLKERMVGIGVVFSKELDRTVTHLVSFKEVPLKNEVAGNRTSQWLEGEVDIQPYIDNLQNADFKYRIWNAAKRKRWI